MWSEQCAKSCPSNFDLMGESPMYVCGRGSYGRRALDLWLASRVEVVPVRFEFILHEAMIYRARSLLADLFVQSDCTHLLFVDADIDFAAADIFALRSEEHTSELQSLMRISYAVFCLKKQTK